MMSGQLFSKSCQETRSFSSVMFDLRFVFNGAFLSSIALLSLFEIMFGNKVDTATLCWGLDTNEGFLVTDCILWFPNPLAAESEFF